MNEVQFVVTEPVTSSVMLTDKFELRRDRPHVWLQRTALWVLRKLKCYSSITETTFMRRIINQDKVSKLIYEQYRSLFQIFHRDGERVLMGGEDFAKLLNEQPFHQLLNFNAKYYRAEGTSLTVHGMPITVVPWMKGVLVIPKGVL